MHTSASKTTHIVIIGGGITGLSAAWYLQSLGENTIEITLIEASPQLGGKMVTHHIKSSDGHFLIDAGPESFVTRKPEAWDLAKELGIADQVINPGSETRNMYVLDGGKPKKIPLSPLAFITSDLITSKGKLRMMLEPIIPPREDDEDESLASFVTRRLGQEALEKMLGPVLAGIYNTDPNTQSIMTTSPVMREMEKEHGGLVRGALARMRSRRKNAPETTSKPQFMTFEDGAKILVDTLEKQLKAQILTETCVTAIESNEDSYQIQFSEHDPIIADALILATPANQASKLLKTVDPESSRLLGQIAHENIGTVTLIFRSDDIDLPYSINGLMIPRREKRRIDAVTWTSNKPMKRGPQGFEMLRIFIGGGDPSIVTLPEDKIIATIREELKDILGIETEPLYSAIFCWPDSFPQAYVGHLQLIDQIDRKLPPNIFVAGSSYRGIGIPDCIRQGRQAAEAVIDVITKKT